MYLEFIDILSNEECNFFLESIKGKKADIPYSKNDIINFYKRYKVENKEIQIKIEQFLYNNFNIHYFLIGNHFWINEVTPLTNKNDIYHLDDTELTVITYLNDNFDGGEFEYLDESIAKKLDPIKNKSIIFNGDINHRTLPVKSGIRYSLVAGFNVPTKKTFSLL